MMGCALILIINLTGVAATSDFLSASALRCGQVVIRVKRRFFNSDAKNDCKQLRTNILQANPKNPEAG